MRKQKSRLVLTFPPPFQGTFQIPQVDFDASLLAF
jgi:hypothetical protein